MLAATVAFFRGAGYPIDSCPTIGLRARRSGRFVPSPLWSHPSPVPAIGYSLIETMRNGITYRDSGVDIEAGDAVVKLIGPLVAATARPGVVGGIGGFAAALDLRAAGYADPILLATTDGVGTKLALAQACHRHDTVGRDLVAMCVNDLVVHGAEPLFFLDYFATGHLRPEEAAIVIGGIAAGCREAGCALVGGETAEMPCMYSAGEYDLAGFAIGAVERGQSLPRGVAAGDVVLGLGANGVHSNGFSLVRHIVAEAGLGWDQPAPFASEQMLGEALLTPTRLYVAPVLALARAGLLKAAAHITGGGLPGNLLRVLPGGTMARLDLTTWEVPPVFRWLARTGGIAAEEMLRVFNCGIGMALVVEAAAVDKAMARLSAAGERVFRIGEIVPSSEPAAVAIMLSAGWPK